MTDNRGMSSKLLTLLFIFSLGQSNFLMAQTAGDKGDVEVPATREEFLTELMKQDKFQNKYKQCQEDPSVSDPAKCFWEDKISKNERKTIQDALKTYEDKNDSSIASEFTAIDLDSDLELSSIQGANGSEKIKEFFKKKLMHALLGDKLKKDGEDENKIVADHRIFYRLYENRVSKNLLEAMSSFCMEAVPSYHNDYLTFIVPEDKEHRKKVRQNYKELLGKVGTGAGKEPVAFNQWQICIQNIQNTCEQKMANFNGGEYFPSKEAALNSGSEVDWTKRVKEKGKKTKYIALNKLKCPTAINRNFTGLVSTSDLCPDSSNIDESTLTVQRACTVSDYMMGARQALNKIKDINKKWDDLEETGTFDNAISNNEELKYFGGGEDENINSLSAISSEEAIVESGYKKEVDSKKELAKECMQDPEQEKCKELVSGNREELKRELRRYDVRAYSMKEKIKNAFEGPDSSKEKQKAILEEEGFKDPEIKELLEDPDELKRKITERYDKKRKALVTNLRNQINNKTIESSDSRDQKEKTFENIHRELSEDSERLRDLIHFNNVVSAYLDVTGNDGESFRNTASLYKELDSIKESENPTFARSAERLKEVAEESNLQKTDAEDADNAKLDSDQLNQNFLGY